MNETVKLAGLRVAPDLDASGYVAGADRVEAANDGMAASANRAGAATDKVGNTLKATSPRISESGNLMARLSHQYVDGYGATVRFEKGVDSLARAIATGNATTAQAEAILEGMYRKLGMMANATDLAEQGHHQLAAAVSTVNARMATQQTVATQATAALRVYDEVGVNSANIAAQLQDVFVTSQMGMNPMQIALQQGTQISAAFGSAGAAGAVKALGAAFVSLVNPVSLFTIGAVAALAAGIQWLGSLNGKAEEAEDALDKHKKLVGEILVGYDAAKEAGARWLEQAAMLPQGVVSSQLTEKLTEQRDLIASQADYAGLLNERIGDYAGLLADAGALDGQLLIGADALADLQAFVAETDQLNISSATSVEELGAMMGRASALMRVIDDPAVDEFLQNIYDWADGLRIARAQASALAAQIGALSFPAVPEEYKNALSTLGNLAPPEMTDRQRATTALNTGLSGAQDEIQRTVLRQQYDAAMTRVAEAERLAAEKEAEKLARQTTPEDSYQKVIDSANERIAQMQLEADVMGLVGSQALMLTNTQGLLAEAEATGVELTEPRIEQLTRLAATMTDLQLTLDGLQVTMENRSPWDVMGEEVQRLNDLMANGKITADTYWSAIGLAAEDMVGQYASAASGIIGQAEKLTGALGLEGKKAFEVEKAISIARAVVAGGEAIVKSYNWGTTLGGPVGGAAAAALAAAATAAQIAAIASTTYQSKSSTAASTASTSTAASGVTPQTGAHITLVGSATDRVSLGDVGALLASINEHLGLQGKEFTFNYTNG